MCSSKFAKQFFLKKLQQVELAVRERSPSNQPLKEGAGESRLRSGTPRQASRD